MLRFLPMAAAVVLLGSAALAQDAPAAPSDAAQPPRDAAAPSQGASPAPAQATAQLAALRKVKDDDRVIAAWNLKVDDVEDRDVDGPDGKELGEIEKVLEDSNGEIRAVVLEYGGFLGFGAKQVVLALDQLQPGPGHRFTTTLTEEQLAASPAWTK